MNIEMFIKEYPNLVAQALNDLLDTLKNATVNVYKNDIVFNEVSERRSGLVSNPTLLQEDNQNKWNINAIAIDFERKYNVNFSEYAGFKR